MKNHGVVQRYSRALFELEGSREKRLEILLRILEIWNKNPEIVSFLNSPLISNNDKVALIKQIINHPEDEKLPAFFCLLIHCHRSNFIPAIIEDYRKRVNKTLGKIEMVLKTAVPMEPKEKEQLIKKLEHLHNHPVRVKEMIDPSIIGGAILAYGNKLIDFSIKGRLEMLRKELCK